MKTSFNISETKNPFSFDVLSIDELASIKGGKSREQDAYAELN